MRWTLLAPLLLVLLVACGFQLRGKAQLPPFMASTELITNNENTAFMRELRLLLEASGVELVSPGTTSSARLQIESQRMERLPLTVSGRAQVREYRLTFELGYRLEDADGQEVLESSRLRMSRDFSFDEGEILATQREEEFLRADLGRAMAEQLIRRLEALDGAGR